MQIRNMERKQYRESIQKMLIEDQLREQALKKKAQEDLALKEKNLIERATEMLEATSKLKAKWAGHSGYLNNINRLMQNFLSLCNHLSPRAVVTQHGLKIASECRLVFIELAKEVKALLIERDDRNTIDFLLNQAYSDLAFMSLRILDEKAKVDLTLVKKYFLSSISILSNKDFISDYLAQPSVGNSPQKPKHEIFLQQVSLMLQIPLYIQEKLHRPKASIPFYKAMKKIHEVTVDSPAFNKNLNAARYRKLKIKIADAEKACASKNPRTLKQEEKLKVLRQKVNIEFEENSKKVIAEAFLLNGKIHLLYERIQECGEDNENNLVLLMEEVKELNSMMRTNNEKLTKYNSHPIVSFLHSQIEDRLVQLDKLIEEKNQKLIPNFLKGADFQETLRFFGHLKTLDPEELKYLGISDIESMIQKIQSFERTERKQLSQFIGTLFSTKDNNTDTVKGKLSTSLPCPSNKKSMNLS